MKESNVLEYKEKITNTFLKTVSAFANFGTGEIKFGITDSGKPVGVNEPKSACLDIENKINDSISPKPRYTLSVNSNNIITLTVYEGLNKPYLYSYTQIVYSTHNAEFVNKIGINNVIVFHNGFAFNLGKELTDTERDYLSANPNTDIFKLFYSRKAILVEGITEELLIKSYLQTRSDLSEIKILSFHKGFTKIIDIWKKLNAGKSDVNYYVKIVDSGNQIQKDASGNELRKVGTIKCNAGFFQKIIAFFQGLFNALPEKKVQP